MNLRARLSALGRIIGLPQSRWPIPLGSMVSDTFEFFPGLPHGYAGHTDYVAMSVVVNDDLAARPPAQQYALLGFGNGFLEGMRGRLADGEELERVHFRMVDAPQQYREQVGWLARLQTSGTDNAGPSTENLHLVTQLIARELGSKGPITMKFWDKENSRKSESLATSGASPARLKMLLDIYQAEFLEGQRQALGAAIVAGPS